MFAGRVAVQNLQKEDLDRDDRIEGRIVPRHAGRATSLGDRCGRQFFRPVLLETTDDLRNTAHGGASCAKGTAEQQFQYAGGAAFCRREQRCESNAYPLPKVELGITKMLMPFVL